MDYLLCFMLILNHRVSHCNRDIYSSIKQDEFKHNYTKYDKGLIPHPLIYSNTLDIYNAIQIFGVLNAQRFTQNASIISNVYPFVVFKKVILEVVWECTHRSADTAQDRTRCKCRRFEASPSSKFRVFARIGRVAEVEYQSVCYDHLKPLRC